MRANNNNNSARRSANNSSINNNNARNAAVTNNAANTEVVELMTNITTFIFLVVDFFNSFINSGADNFGLAMFIFVLPNMAESFTALYKAKQENNLRSFEGRFNLVSVIAGIVFTIIALILMTNGFGLLSAKAAKAAIIVIKIIVTAVFPLKSAMTLIRSIVKYFS